MADENVNAGSEDSGDQAADTSKEATAVDTAAETTEKSAETAQDAGGAAEQKAGDACTCPDGRTGTLHANDAGDGFVCIPNENQG